jgi:MFS family permease
VLAAGAAGTLLAAAVTPAAVRRWGRARWITGLLVLGGVGQLALGGLFVPWAIVSGVLTLGFVAQGIKICVDTTLQEAVDDDYRGRVFSAYDTLFNVTFVAALLAGALLLPESGMSWPLLLVIGVGYLLTALAFARWAQRSGFVAVTSAHDLRSADEGRDRPSAPQPVGPQPRHGEAE